ncbi:MAG: urease accessory protein UreD [Phormidesmis sp.]
MAYPLSVSPIFRLEDKLGAASTRAYLYRMNTSPGLLAGDAIGISLQMTSDSQLYLADQSATKVHAMPPGETASVNYSIELGEQTTLEFLPEPLILFTDAALTQQTEITINASAGLSLGEIILPGRLARGEVYQFRQYLSRIRVRSTAGKLLFVEAMNLIGKGNLFAQSSLFASGRVLGSLVLILPEAIATPENLSALGREIEALADKGEEPSLDLASSVLPGDRGLFVRAIATTTRELQSCFRNAINRVRKLRNQAQLPYSV